MNSTNLVHCSVTLSNLLIYFVSCEIFRGQIARLKNYLILKNDWDFKEKLRKRCKEANEKN